MDHTSDTIYASFPIKKTSSDNLKECQIIIWTTTPWTIPANKALAYNENLKYLIIQILGESKLLNSKIIVAKELLESFVKECNIKDYKILNEVSGNSFQGTICKHPFFDIG